MKKGVSILIAVLITSIVLATGLSVVSIFILELRTSGLASESIRALYAAESAVEWQLYELRKEAITRPGIGGNILSNNTMYDDPTVSIIGTTVTIRAVGTSCRGLCPINPTAKRALEIKFIQLE